ncbi:MAG TPA: asparagine synthase (glutamine-hydrolyzing) [Solirubrobacterales bacterium]|jgi:asparagine synthase (glutamine-hydrolysing)|nr:asparagine synthase (glutamine-hydrolyzing) [Solirubrobacterales bacterium]
MCGICGHTRDPEGAAARAMNGAMVHRGPDDEGVHSDAASGVSLGARRLSVIDVEHGHQPLANEDGTIWAALNGEIYNHPRLQQLLRERGHTLATGTDTEVLVHLYEEYGADLVHALEGMFAFAIWDTRTQTLLVARDRFGEKPLFYANSGDDLAFASELTALAAGADLGAELDPVAVHEYFVFGYVPGERSIVAGARQLPPGHLLTWKPGGKLEERRYWSPPAAAVSEAGESTADLVGELGRLLSNSVRSRLIADVPLGVFLSGGVDSTLIAALAARESSHPVKTFTVGYDVGDVSEAEAARATAREIGSEHHELVLKVDEIAARVPAVLRGLDQPQADQSLPAFQAIAGFARESVTVAVGGEGADELFGGYPRYRWLSRAEALGATVPASLAKPAARLLAAGLPAGRAGRLADVLEPRSAMERHIDWIAGERLAMRDTLYGPRLNGSDPLAGLAAGLDGLVAPDGLSVAGRFMLLDQLHWLPGDVLAKADRASMQVSLEVRTPYLNHELAEFAATVPPDLQTGGGGKSLLRLLLAELLPESSMKRPKTAFRVPAADWLRGPLSPILLDQVNNGHVCEEGWIDRAAAAKLLDRHIASEADGSAALWPILAFGLWLDRLRGRDAGL